MLISNSGSVWACGWSADGQTGVGHYRNTDRITKCVGDIVGEKIVDISCSGDCVLALSGEFKLYYKIIVAHILQLLLYLVTQKRAKSSVGAIPNTGNCVG